MQQAKKQIWALFCENSLIMAAIEDRRISFGSAAASDAQAAYYWTKNAELLSIIMTWGGKG